MRSLEQIQTEYNELSAKRVEMLKQVDLIVTEMVKLEGMAQLLNEDKKPLKEVEGTVLSTEGEIVE